MFVVDELVIVFSHFDLGVICVIKEFPCGLCRAPKLLIKAECGFFLLKCCAMGKDGSEKVVFCHGIQLHLAKWQFLLLHLIGIRIDNNLMLCIGEQTYELFEYI